MGASHGHALYHHGHTRIHHLVPQAKVAAAFTFVVAVSLTPEAAPWAYAIDLIVIVLVATAARLPVRFVVARMSVVIPFVGFALLIPFVATGPQTQVLGMSVSRTGMVAALAILSKAVIGILVSIVLTATTEQHEILSGLERLHVPVVLTGIAAVMLRYVTLVAGEMGRMRIAMTARGYDPRWLWQVRPIASAAGALFVRSFERGERVHAAMLARGYGGTMPDLAVHRPTRSRLRADWLLASLAPAAVAVVTTAALVVT